MPARRSSRLVVAGALCALVLVSSVLVILIDATPVVNQVQQNLVSPLISPPEEGYLLVELDSNENFSSVVSTPLSQPAPVGGWPFTVTPINSSLGAALQSSIVTGRRGIALAQLVSGTYVLETSYQTLGIVIPVVVSPGDVTEVSLGVTESAYPTLYTEEGALGAQSSVYVEVPSSSPVANVSEPVLLEVQDGGAGSAYLVHATVASSQQPVLGRQWLGLVTLVPFDPVNANAMLLTTWRYSAVVQPPVPAGRLPLGLPPQND